MVALTIAGAVAATAVAAAQTLAEYRVEADRIDAALDGAQGDAARGRTLVLARDVANCLLCHGVPEPEVRFSGDVGPPLAGVGTRLTKAQIRLRIVDNTKRDPLSIMPSYFRVDGLQRVAPAYRDKPILTAQQVEDLVAYLSTLR